MEKQFIETAAKEVAMALKDAAAEYGPQALDMLTLVYRMSALQSIIVGIVFAITSLAIFRVAFKVKALLAQHNGDGAEYVPFAIGCGLAGIFAVTAIAHIVDIYNWAAIFGYPEVLIAYKALVAAGLM